MQGLFGRFGKKTPEAEVSSPNYQTHSTPDRVEVDAPEYSSAASYDDDEETNWDDAETSENENNPILRPQPSVPAVTPPLAFTTPDPENWDEALPAATVKNSNRQEARRGKQLVPMPLDEDIWDEDLRDSRLSTSSSLNSSAASADRLKRAVGLWTTTIRQFRRILPASLRQLSDPILTAIVVALVTVAIWFVDSFALPGVDPSVANTPSVPVTSQPNSVAIAPQINPEQAFIEAIQTQLNDITSQYPDEIVRALQVDAAGDRLIVQIDRSWYTLDADRQNDLTASMWNQAKSNHFTKLEIQDAQGRSIARSPVVGRSMIILQRHQS